MKVGGIEVERIDGITSTARPAKVMLGRADRQPELVGDFAL
jgi:hypothetical protein